MPAPPHTLAEIHATAIVLASYYHSLADINQGGKHDQGSKDDS